MKATDRSAPADSASTTGRLSHGGSTLAPARPIRSLAALAAIRRAFSRRPLATRVHVLGRFLTCPFLRTLRHLSAGADVLDVGAGHGLLAALAVEAGVASITTLEPDLRKTLATFRHPRVRAVAGLVNALGGRFDVATLYDVFYRIPIDDREPLLIALRGLLRPGGLLLIKEMDPERPLKAAWNRAQEWVSDHFLGLTIGTGFYYEPPGRVLERLTRCGFENCAMEDIGRFYPHAHVVYTARAPG